MVTRNQLVVLLAIAGLLSTVGSGTTTVFARSHIHLWLPYGARAHLWGSGSAPDLDVAFTQIGNNSVYLHQLHFLASFLYMSWI